MKDDRYRLEQVVKTGESLLETIERRGIDANTIEHDQEIQWMLTTPLYHIGEQVYHLSRDLTERYPDVPWMAIAGLRHRLVHDYEGTDWRVINEVATDELEPFIKRIREVLSEVS